MSVRYMQTLFSTHYQAYKPRPFTKEERSKVTVVFGGLTWKHERLIQGVMHNLEYKAEPLPNVTRADLNAGKELIDVGACCPTIFTTGNLVNFAKSKLASEGKQHVLDNYVFMTAGACGPCRFGQYHESYSMALDGLGLRDFRMFLLAQDQLDQGAGAGRGIEVNLKLSTGIIWAILCADVLSDLEYMTRPYEVNAGQTAKVLSESIEYMYNVFRKRPLRFEKWGVLAWHVLTDYFTGALREVRKKWDAIRVDRLQVKPKIKITGEFWLQTHEGDGNYSIKRWLEDEGAEVVPPPIAVWLHYLLYQPIFRAERHEQVDKHARFKIRLLKGLEKIYLRTYNRFRKALGNIPNALPDQEELRRLAKPFFNHQLRGGEGHMLVGKALHAYHHKKAHMICELSPYACMPNTMSIGSMANVLGKFPDLLYAPIEVKGDAEIQALSRCQMILAEAKKRAQREFDQVLERVNIDAIREYEARHPEVTRATYRLPHYSLAGTAGNYVTHLAKLSGAP